LAVAVVGIVAYRTLSFWLPMPASLALLPKMRSISQEGARPAETTPETTDDEPSLRRHA
jgi:hypothetical protein